MKDFELEDELDEEKLRIPKVLWRCEECGYESHTKPHPKNRQKFYSRPMPPKCPDCKSESFMPVGY